MRVGLLEFVFGATTLYVHTLQHEALMPCFGLPFSSLKALFIKYVTLRYYNVNVGCFVHSISFSQLFQAKHIRNNSSQPTCRYLLPPALSLSLTQCPLSYDASFWTKFVFEISHTHTHTRQENRCSRRREVCKFAKF